jgi:hypothetical protein
MAAVPLVQLRRADDGTLRRCLQLLMAAVMVWTAMTFLDGLGISPPVTYTFTKLTYLGIPLVPTAFLVVTLAYTDRGEFLARRLVALLAVEPVLVNGVVWTNRLPELFGRSTGRRPRPPPPATDRCSSCTPATCCYSR